MDNASHRLSSSIMTRSHGPHCNRDRNQSCRVCESLDLERIMKRERQESLSRLEDVKQQRRKLEGKRR